jgi:hypothetical protein
MDIRPGTPTPAPASYTPSPADLDEMSTIHLIHDLLDVAPDMPLETKLALLDFAAAVLEGSRRATSAADRAA